MKPLILILSLFFNYAAFGQQSNNTNRLSCAGLDKQIFYYLDNPKYPEHLFTLLFNCSNDTLRGALLGVDIEGGEGIFFFKSNLDSIVLKNNKITFSFVQGDLYQKPFTVKNYDKPIDSNIVVGGSSYPYFLKGYLHSDTITFICTMRYYGCYADTMSFVKHFNPIK